MEEKTKICSKCKKELSFSMFRWRNQAKGTKHSQCKECEKERDKIHYAESKERRQAVLETVYFQKNRNLQIVEQIKSCGCQKCGEKENFY